MRLDMQLNMCVDTCEDTYKDMSARICAGILCRDCYDLDGDAGGVHSGGELVTLGQHFFTLIEVRAAVHRHDRHQHVLARATHLTYGVYSYGGARDLPSQRLV